MRLSFAQTATSLINLPDILRGSVEPTSITLPEHYHAHTHRRGFQFRARKQTKTYRKMRRQLERNAHRINR